MTRTGSSLQPLLVKLARWKRRAARHATAAASAWRYADSLARTHGFSRVRMLAEAGWYALRGRMDVDTYFCYHLFDPTLSTAAKRTYLSEAPGANERLWSFLTPTRYRCLFDNKLIFNRFFAAVGLPLATVFGVFDPEVGRSSEGDDLRTEAQLETLIRRLPENGFVFKPVEGMRGHLTLILTGPAPDKRDAFLALSGERYDAASLMRLARNTALLEMQNPGANVTSFLLEERIRPHPDLAAFIGPTLCTVRVLTIIALGGRPEIVAAVFKLQPKAVGVDHLQYGAVGCWVDLKTGTLGRGRTRTHLDNVSAMPVTEKHFVGYPLPCWEQVKEVALRAAASFPWARAIGWDIAISDRGPILIEGNERWSPSLVQLPAPYGLMDGDLRALYDSLRRRDAG